MPKLSEQNEIEAYIGIDPGARGGIAILYSDGEVEVFPIPESLLGLWKIFQTLGKLSCKAYVEYVHAMPGQGVTSMFSFGCRVGELHMGLTAAQIPFELITPKRWQAALHIPSRKTEKKRVNGKLKSVKESDTEWKGRLCTVAQRLFPSLEVWGETLKNQRAVCDALLIAELCRREKQV